jgi:hypothetical protein
VNEEYEMVCLPYSRERNSSHVGTFREEEEEEEEEEIVTDDDEPLTRVD